MKRIKNSFLYITVLITAMTILFGCSSLGQADKCEFVYKAEVTYSDATVDTFVIIHEAYENSNVNVYIKISESGFLSSNGTVPCLVLSHGFSQYVIACGVRKYRILEQNKKPLNK